MHCLRGYASPNKSRSGTFKADAIRASASTEMVFSIRSTSPMYFGFKLASSPRRSCVRFRFFRHARIVPARTLRCGGYAATRRQRSRSCRRLYTSYSWYSDLHSYMPFGNVEIMNTTPTFLRRLGPDPHINGNRTAAVRGCPDIFELESGDFAIIGSDITTDAVPNLPESASCGPDERVVRIPRKTLVLAKQDIPDQP